MKRRSTKPPAPPAPAAAPELAPPPVAAPAPPSTLSPADFRALRDLVSGRVHGVDANVRDRLVRDGWATCDAGVYFFTDEARAFVRALPADREAHWYSGAATLILTALAVWLLVACDFLVGAAFVAAGAGDSGAEVLVDALAADDAPADIDAADVDAADVTAGDAGPPDALVGSDATDEVLVDALGSDSAGDAPATDAAGDDAPAADAPDLDAPDLDAGDSGAGLDAGGPSCDAGTVLHNDGVGQTFCDPTPLGSYPSSLVRAACDAFARATPSAICTEASSEGCPSAVTATVSTATLALCLTWTNAGRVHDAGAGVCACAAPTDPAWQ
jgi:hypothetical protein